MLRLYTFAISHFSEKARWVLDYEGIAYEEHRLVPGPHMIATRWLAPGTSVPILRDDRHVIQGSSAIVDHVLGPLGGSRLASGSAEDQERARHIEARADHAFGRGVQRIFYAAALDDRRLVTGLWSQGGPAWAKPFYAVAYPGVAAAVRRMYDTRPEAVARAKQRFAEALTETDRLLSEQPYLGGERPGRADIAVAALLAPFCRPPEHPIGWPDPPPTLIPFVREHEGRPTWRHVLKLYQQHRSPAPAGAVRAA